MTRKRKKKLKINFGQWRNCHFRHQPAHDDVVGSAINGDLQRTLQRKGQAAAVLEKH
jgi:hypothetical protein